MTESAEGADGLVVSRRQALRTALLALGGALLALLAFVLPAEYGVDPLGTGRVTGLLALAEPEQSAFVAAQAALQREQVAFRLEPFESVEYKYRLEGGQAMIFDWRATAPVLAELHAEPDQAPAGSAERYQRRRSDRGAGSYRADFPGWHGWFWENREVEPVTVTLNAAGFFSAARTYGGGRMQEQSKGLADAQ